MIKYSKLPSIKISFEGTHKSESDILKVYSGQNKELLGILEVIAKEKELEIIFFNENYKNTFYDTIDALINSELAENNRKAKEQAQQQKLEKDLEYFMGALYEMRENGVLRKNSPPIPHPPIKGIVLQGGGIKGLAYLGALEKMEKAGVLKETEFVCGSSSGALNALFIATGLSADQIKQYCMDFDTRNLMDARNSALGEYQAGGLASIIKGVVQTMGAYGEPKTARELLRNILFHLTGDADVTFAELEEMRKINPAIKEFLCTATLLPETGMGAGETRLFSHRTSPNVVVADAVLASMSLPGVWVPVTIRQKVYESHHQYYFKEIGTYSDGGIHNNFPVDVANEYVKDDEYLMIPRNGKYSFVLDNPCVLSLSLCTAKELNEAICPIPNDVKNLAIRNSKRNEQLFEMENVNKAKLDLEEYQSLSIPSIINPTSSRLTKLVSPHKKSETSNARRLFNIVVANQVEDTTEKNKLHNEGAILLYDNNISAGKFGLSNNEKNELIMIGSHTTKNYFLEKRNPTIEYSHPDHYRHENLDKLYNDKMRNEKLNALFVLLGKEFKNYTKDSNSLYLKNTMKNNIKIQHLYWQINKIYNTLETKPNDFDYFVSTKLKEILYKEKNDEDFHAAINDNFYKKLTNEEVIKTDLIALLKQKPFDEREFFNRFTALGAQTIIELSNKYSILLLTAARVNPKAFDIMLTAIEHSYKSLHQVPRLATFLLGKPRMHYEDTKCAYAQLLNKPYENKPLIFHCIDANQCQSVKSLTQHHANKYVFFEGKSVFQYAIETGRIECFIQACKANPSENEHRLNGFIIRQYDNHTNFGKFITFGFQKKRTLAHILFSITDKSTLKRSLNELMKPENEAVWTEFKKALYQADNNGITPLDLASENLDEETFFNLLNNIRLEPSNDNRYVRSINYRS